MHWIVRDTIENPYFFKGVLSVENDLPFEEVCQFMSNQMSYEQGRLFNTYLKSIGKSYKHFLTEAGRIKPGSENSLLSVVYPIQKELDFEGFDLIDDLDDAFNNIFR